MCHAGLVFSDCKEVLDNRVCGLPRASESLGTSSLSFSSVPGMACAGHAHEPQQGAKDPPGGSAKACQKQFLSHNKAGNTLPNLACGWDGAGLASVPGREGRAPLPLTREALASGARDRLLIDTPPAHTGRLAWAQAGLPCPCPGELPRSASVSYRAPRNTEQTQTHPGKPAIPSRSTGFCPPCHRHPGSLRLGFWSKCPSRAHTHGDPGPARHVVAIWE